MDGIPAREACTKRPGSSFLSSSNRICAARMTCGVTLTRTDNVMRPETLAMVDDIKQSLSLLRRYL
jgi:hypothetical protein